MQKDVIGEKKSGFLSSKKEIFDNFSGIRAYGLIALF